MIEAKGVTKSYGFGESKADILKGIDLQISDGDFAVILGASGYGKSTLLNCLSGLERVDGGSIEYDGLNIAELSDKALTKFRKENIGFMPKLWYGHQDHRYRSAECHHRSAERANCRPGAGPLHPGSQRAALGASASEERDRQDAGRYDDR